MLVSTFIGSAASNMFDPKLYTMSRLNGRVPPSPTAKVRGVIAWLLMDQVTGSVAYITTICRLNNIHQSSWQIQAHQPLRRERPLESSRDRHASICSFFRPVKTALQTRPTTLAELLWQFSQLIMHSLKYFTPRREVAPWEISWNVYVDQLFFEI